MKKNILLIAVTLLGIFAADCNLLYAQKESRNGYRTSPTGTIRILLVFAEVDFNSGSCTTNPTGSNWPAGQLPNDADTYFDPFITANPQGILTRFYKDASFGNYNVLGDYYDKVITVSCSDVSNSGVPEVLAVLNAESDVIVGGVPTLVTRHNIPLNDFDLWTSWPSVPEGEPNTFNGAGNADGKIDAMMIVWRNHPAPVLQSGGGLAPINGLGMNSPLKNKTGFNNLGSQGADNSDASNILITEWGHPLFGQNWWHDGGGAGAHTFITTRVFRAHGFGLNQQAESVMDPMVNAWDRNHLEWLNPPDKNVLISARDGITGNEINTDLSMVNQNTSGDGTYILRDFVPYGDAVRIKLPYINFDTDGIKNQYLWIENHQMATFFDHNHYPAAQTNGCTDDLLPGIYAYIQIGKDVISGNNMFNATPYSLPNSLGSWTWPLSAEGNYDFIYRYDHIGPKNCVEGGGLQLPVEKDPARQNPFTGHSDLYQATNSNRGVDSAGNLVIYTDDSLINPSQDQITLGHAEVIGNQVFKTLPRLGDDQDAFRCVPFCPKKILSLGTNPAPVPVYTHRFPNISFNPNNPQTFYPQYIQSYENRTIWLNGLSVEILEQEAYHDGTGAVKVKVRWNDYEVDNNVRWCGNIMLSPSVNGITGALDDPAEYALNLLPGNTIHLDHGLSPTRDRNPVMVNGEQAFADPTTFTLLPNSYFHMEPNSTVIVDNGSTFIIQQDAKLEVHENSAFIVRNGSTLILEQGAILHSDGLVKIEPGCTLVYNNSDIQLNDANAVLEIGGTLDIQDNATFTFSPGNAGCGYIRFTNPSYAPTILAGTNSRFVLDNVCGGGKVLELNNGNLMVPQALNFFHIENGIVAVKGSGNHELSIGSHFNLTGVTFNAQTPGAGRVLTFGQGVAIVDQCIFNGVSLEALNVIQGHRLSVTNSEFRDNPGWALLTIGEGISLYNVTYLDNGRGMFCIAPEGPVIINGGDFSGNHQYGMEYMWGSEAPVRLTGAKVDGNYPGGIYADDVALRIKCGSVADNSANSGGMGIHLLNNSILNMSGASGAGYVDASGNKTTVRTENARLLQLGLGFNNLEPIGTGGIFGPSYNLRGTVQLPACPNPVLVADNNRWGPFANSAPGSTYGVDLVNTGLCQVTVTDHGPGIIASCGTYDPNPCPGFSVPCSEILLNNCPSCPVINTGDFNNVKLNDAVAFAIASTELEDPSKDDLAAIGLFHQILTLPLDRNNPSVNYLIALAYAHMKGALGGAFANGKITEADNATTFHPSVQKTLDVQDALANDSITGSDVKTWFFLKMDKAHTHRLAGRRNSALSLLRAADTCLLSDADRKYLYRRIALVGAEVLVLSGQEPAENFIALLEAAGVMELPGINFFDSTATVDPTATLGEGVSIGANTTIESGASIGDNTTIGGNVTIGQDVTVGTGSAIGDNTVIAAGTRVGSGTAIGNNVTVAEKTVIGDNTTIGGYATVQEKTVIGSGVTIGAYTAVGEKAAISDGAALGESNMIGGKTAIGANVTTGDMVELGEKVMIGDATFVGTGTAVNGKTLIGAWVNVASSLNIGEKVQVCDSHTVATDVPDKAILCSPGVVSPPTLASAVVHDCAFALSTALVRGHFFNGFTAVSGGSDTLCTNRAVRFTPDAFSNATFWDFGDCATSTDAAPTHTYAGPGVYIIRFVQDFHCITDTLIGSVTVFPNPEPAFTLSASCDTLREVTVTGALPPGDLSAPGCFGQSPSCPSFTPLDTAMLRVKYRYDFGSGAFPPAEVYYSLTQAFSGASSAFTLAYPVDSAFEIALTATLQQFDVHDAVWKDMGSCAGTYTETLQTTGPVQAGVAAAAVACTGQPAAFESTVTGGYSPFTYTWDFGDGNTSTAQNPENTYSDPGSFTASLAVTDRDGCADTAYRNVEVTPSNITAGFYFEAQGLSVTFSDLSAGAAEFHWDFGDGFTSTLQNPVHEYAAPGDYTVCQAISNPCGADTFCLEVEVGATAFQKAYGGPGEEGGTCVINTSDGGFAALGYTGSFGAGNLDVSAIKTDGDGTILWSKAYGGSNLDDANSIRQTADGGYIIAGRTRSFGSALNKGLVIKTDANGDVQWSKVFTLPGNLFFSVVREVSGGYAIAGNTDVGAGGKNILFARLDSSGNPVFVKAIGGGGDQFCRHLQTTRDGGFLILGDTRAGSDIDVLVIKTDAAGTIQWSRSYSGILVDFGQSTEEIELLCTCDGGFVISGYTNSQGFGGNDGMMFKIDTLGGLLWSKTYGGAGDEHFATIKEELSTHSLITCGATTSFGSGQSDIYWVESDHNGNLLGSGTYGGAGIEHSSSTDDIFQITPDGGVAIIGQTNSFGAGGNDAYFIKTDPGGASGCNEAAPVATQEAPATVAVSAVSLPVVNTSFATVGHALVVSGGATVETSICPQPQAKMGNTGGGKHMAGADDGDADEGDEADMASGSYLNAYPNPFGGKTTIEFMLPADGRVKLEVVNLAGERVALLFDAEAQAGSVYRVGFDAANAGAGFYFCTLSGDGIRITGKLVAVGRL